VKGVFGASEDIFLWPRDAVAISLLEESVPCGAHWATARRTWLGCCAGPFLRFQRSIFLHSGRASDAPGMWRIVSRPFVSHLYLAKAGRFRALGLGQR